MAPVVIMLRTIFVAVPALSRVEPLMISGPTIGQIMMSHSGASQLVWLQARPIVAAWNTAGVNPGALILTSYAPGGSWRME